MFYGEYEASWYDSYLEEICGLFRRADSQIPQVLDQSQFSFVGNPRTLRCASHRSGILPLIPSTDRLAGCPQLRIAATISGARNA